MASKQSWERMLFDRLAGSSASSIVLFAAGGNGRKILRGLRSLGIEPLAFSDQDPRLWGTEVDGLVVLPPEVAAKKYGENSTFVVTILSPGPNKAFPIVREWLRALDCKTVIPFPALTFKYPSQFLPNYYVDLPHRVIEEADLVREAYNLWTDDESRREFLDQIQWRSLLDYDALSASISSEVQYFPEGILSRRTDEVFVDCGAYDGDTIRSFLGFTRGEFGRLVALEPDPVNFEKVSSFVRSLSRPIQSRIELIQAGVGRKREILRFSANGNSSAAISEEGPLEIEVVPLDEVALDPPPTYIKMDIEAAEPDAIAGAAGVIRGTPPCWRFACTIDRTTCGGFLFRLVKLIANTNFI